MRRLAGKGAAREEALLAELLEKDFDPEEYDAQMAAAFGEEYYRQGVGAGAEEEKEVLDPAVAKVRLHVPVPCPSRCTSKGGHTCTYCAHVVFSNIKKHHRMTTIAPLCS